MLVACNGSSSDGVEGDGLKGQPLLRVVSCAHDAQSSTVTIDVAPIDPGSAAWGSTPPSVESLTIIDFSEIHAYEDGEQVLVRREPIISVRTSSIRLFLPNGVPDSVFFTALRFEAAGSATLRASTLDQLVGMSHQTPFGQVKVVFADRLPDSPLESLRAVQVRSFCGLVSRSWNSQAQC
jgi:hypothetical protein